MRVLFVTSEAFPLAKTGGLGDVGAALPAALVDSGVDVRLLLPAYPQAKERAELTDRALDLGDPLGAGPTRLLEGRMPGSGVPTWLVDCPALFERAGGPYLGPDGRDWPDNHLRFGLLGRVAALVGARGAPDGWRPDVIHANDWQAGTAAAHLSLEDRSRAKTLFTIHNLGYPGVFPPDALSEIGLPGSMMDMYGVEFHGQVSFLKSGLYYSDALSTVSPTYAAEIQTREFGCGFEGLLSGRSGVLHGILNGIDTLLWDPATDAAISARFSVDDLAGKAGCKRDLQLEMGLTPRSGTPLMGVVSRLTDHKGLDLVADSVDELIGAGVQLVVLGSGDPWLEAAFGAAADQYPGQVAVRIGYDEALAHRIQAGSDLLAVPSRFEPCGLTQMIAMRYGTLPVVRATGGLADTVTDATDPRRGTGFAFLGTRPEDWLGAVRRALALYDFPDGWRLLQRRAMAQAVGWAVPARRYAELYEQLVSV